MTQMYAKIDWYATMIDLIPPEDDSRAGGSEWVLSQLKIRSDLGYFGDLAVENFEEYPGRGVFSKHLHFKTGGLDIWLMRDSLTVKVEITGQGCDLLVTHGVLNYFIDTTRARCCRIDYAIDIVSLDAVSAAALCEVIALETKRHDTRKSHSEAHSASGDTYYFGSWSSERYARCYLYHEPHPRAKIVRLEAVYKGKWAKKSLETWGEVSLPTLVKSAHLTYQWKGVDLGRLSDSTVEMKLPPSDKTGGAHIRWLLTVCVPALRKALNEGEISEEYLHHEIFVANSVG